MANKKVLNSDKSQTVWQYVFIDNHNRVETSKSKFVDTKAAEKYFNLLKSEGSLEHCRLLGFYPVYQHICDY